MRTLVLGEALVDLVCERPVDGVAEAEAFFPRFGGMAANVAVNAARCGADVSLGGGVGDDGWGRWLEARLESERVGLEWFSRVEGAQTPIAFVTTNRLGEPSFQVYGDSIAMAMSAFAPKLEEAIAACDGLFIGSNTLVGPRERELTMRARELALARNKAVMLDPNVRLGRWRTAAEAAAAANACVPGALLVKCNAHEATLLTGERDPELAATALVKAGARMVVITLGAEGAILRGELRADAPGVAARVASTVGAGDAFAGVLVARLSLTGFYPPAVAAALPEATAEAAHVTERWDAVG